MLKLSLLGISGALGTISRYFIDGLAYQVFGSQFPYGTLTVNVGGCLVIGFLGTLADERFLLNPQLRFLLLFGFLGAFTTFSTFAYETWTLFKGGEFFLAGWNVFLNLAVCFFGLMVGVFSARLL